MLSARRVCPKNNDARSPGHLYQRSLVLHRDQDHLTKFHPYRICASDKTPGLKRISGCMAWPGMGIVGRWACVGVCPRIDVGIPEFLRNSEARNSVPGIRGIRPEFGGIRNSVRNSITCSLALTCSCIPPTTSVYASVDLEFMPPPQTQEYNHRYNNKQPNISPHICASWIIRDSIWG